jgi:hypothetical protein
VKGKEEFNIIVSFMTRLFIIESESKAPILKIVDYFYVRPETTIARSGLVILIFIFALFVAPVNVKNFEKAHAQPIKTVNTIRIGTVDIDAVKQIMKFQPTADYIAAKISNETTQYKGEVIIPRTVNEYCY